MIWPSGGAASTLQLICNQLPSCGRQSLAACCSVLNDFSLWLVLRCGGFSGWSLRLASLAGDLGAMCFEKMPLQAHGRPFF